MRSLAAAAAAAAAAAIAAPVALVERLADARPLVTVVPPPAETVRLDVALAGGEGELELAAGRYPALPRAWYGQRVIVHARSAVAAVELELRDEDARLLARCAFPRGSYRVERRQQQALLACPVERPEELRRVVVRVAAGPRAVSVPVQRTGRLVGGELLREAPRGQDAAFARLAVARPPGFRGPTLLAALAASLLLLAAAAWLARRVA